MDDPEKEFNKTALDTIVTQEAELRKLKEGMEIRNKKIMQLEDTTRLAASVTHVNGWKILKEKQFSVTFVTGNVQH